MNERILVVGIGRQKFGDDAVGLVVVEGLRRRLFDVAGFILDATDGWQTLADTDGVELLIVVDAAQFTQCFPPGEWRRIEYPAQSPAIEECILRETHSMSVESMLRMARQLGRLPGEVWIYAVSGKEFRRESDLSPEVSAVIDELTERIARDVRAWQDGQVKQKSQ